MTRHDSFMMRARAGFKRTEPAKYGLQVWLSAAQKKKLADAARRTGRTMTSLVREMIDRAEVPQ
jgi:hypothetical protein